MKICWDNLEKHEIYLTKNGKFRGKKTGYKFTYMESCESCKEPYLALTQSVNNGKGLYCCIKCKPGHWKDKKFTNKHKNNIKKGMKKSEGKFIRYGKECSSWKGGVSKLELTFYNTYFDRIKNAEIIRKNKNDFLEAKCNYCGKWFFPKRDNILNRIYCFEGRDGYKGESRLYCSEYCKECCPIYGKTPETLMREDAVRAGRDPWWYMVREVQPELRQMVFKRDGYKCIKCENKKHLHCHHVEGILWEPLQSADIDMCITVCKDCHMKIHKIPGCRYDDMKCK